jgi:coenzyme F420-0:L-glutamate ligase/coenzyme F420-1:gamma-L-glutamate ligase
LSTNLQAPSGLSIIPITGIKEIQPGDDLAEVTMAHATLHDHDVVVVTQKVVSKAEGRIVHLAENDDDAFERLVTREARRILRRRGSLMITETHHGFICANAGIDRSNTATDTVVLLPVDPDLSARRIQRRIEALSGTTVGVIITDTFGRTWRNGVTDVAIGCAGIAGVVDLRGQCDAHGRTLQATEVCIADEIAGAADLVKPKDANIPVVIVRGLDASYFRSASVSSEIIRAPQGDLFR